MERPINDIGLLEDARARGLDLDGASNDRDRAVRVHDFVRDQVRFGLTPWFDAADARTTLRLGVGHCNPQATLFVDLLRAMGVEARPHLVTISNEILRGLWPVPPRLSHAFSEVRLDGRWLRVDSYIVDPALRQGALTQLQDRGWTVGLGLHVDGTDRWDGRSDAFSQFARDDMALADHGTVQSLRAFIADRSYQHRVGPLPLHAWLRPLRPLGSALLPWINGRVEALRRPVVTKSDRS